MITVADTAFAIACVRAEEQELFEDRYAHLFQPPTREAAEAVERYLALPLFREGIRLRTRFIDDEVRRGVREGLCQVVILGVGFDMRALRLPELAAVQVFEVDVPAQLDRKRALLAAGDVTVPERVVHVPCAFDGDFGPRLLVDLTTRGFVPGAGALFVWEGVIGYIDGQAIDRSLAFMAHAGGKGTRVVFTWGQPSIDPDSLEQRTSRAGFTAVEDVGCDELWRRLLPGEPHPYAHVSRLAVASV